MQINVSGAAVTSRSETFSMGWSVVTYFVATVNLSQSTEITRMNVETGMDVTALSL